MEFTLPIKEKKKIEEIKQVLKSNPQSLLLFVFAISSGIRCKDILSIRVGDVRDAKHIKLVEMKTKKTKKIIINDALKALLVPFIRDMRDDEFIFQSRQGINKPISRSQAHRIITKATSKVGLSEIGFHGLRKTLAYHIYVQSGFNVGLVMSLLNHSSEKTTLRYLGLTQDFLDEAILKVNL
jgi:integrase